jgi:hypothetical protein
MLLRSDFREKLLDPDYVDRILHDNQYWHWRGFRWFRWNEAQASLAQGGEGAGEKSQEIN